MWSYVWKSELYVTIWLYTLRSCAKNKKQPVLTVTQKIQNKGILVKLYLVWLVMLTYSWWLNSLCRVSFSLDSRTTPVFSNSVMRNWRMPWTLYNLLVLSNDGAFIYVFYFVVIFRVHGNCELHLFWKFPEMSGIFTSPVILFLKIVCCVINRYKIGNSQKQVGNDTFTISILENVWALPFLMINDPFHICENVHGYFPVSWASCSISLYFQAPLCGKEAHILTCPMNCWLFLKHFPHCLLSGGRKKEIFSSEVITLFPYKSKCNFERFMGHLYIWPIIILSYLCKIKT